MAAVARRQPPALSAITYRGVPTTARPRRRPDPAGATSGRLDNRLHVSPRRRRAARAVLLTQDPASGRKVDRTMPDITLLDLLNLAMAVVIWMVQIIVYPGLAALDEPRLRAWHPRYSRRIAYFVVPLMTGKAALVGLAVLRDGGAAALAMAAMEILCWAATFALAVPQHRRIAAGREPLAAARRLVTVNWPRTALWTAVLAAGLLSPV
jgi:hypothetical protein